MSNILASQYPIFISLKCHPILISDIKKIAGILVNHRISLASRIVTWVWVDAQPGQGHLHGHETALRSVWVCSWPFPTGIWSTSQWDSVSLIHLADLKVSRSITRSVLETELVMLTKDRQILRFAGPHWKMTSVNQKKRMVAHDPLSFNLLKSKYYPPLKFTHPMSHK